MVCRRFVAVSEAEIVSGLELTVHYMTCLLCCFRLKLYLW